MATKGESLLPIQSLPEHATSAAKACGKLLSEGDKFKPLQIGDMTTGNYDVWSDNDSLLDITRDFVSKATSLIKVRRPQLSCIGNKLT